MEEQRSSFFISVFCLCCQKKNKAAFLNVTVLFSSRVTEIRFLFSWLPPFGVLAVLRGNLLIKASTRPPEGGACSALRCFLKGPLQPG